MKRTIVFLFIILVGSFALAGDLAGQLNNKGVRLMREGDAKGAVDALAAAYSSGPTNESIRLNYALALANLAVLVGKSGQNEQGIEYLKKARELAPDRQDVGLNLSILQSNHGTALSQVGKYDEADRFFKAAYETASEQNSRLIDKLRANNLVLSSREKKGQGHRIAAIDLLEEAISIFPDCLPAMIDLGSYYNEEGDSEMALAYFGLALLLDPSVANLKDQVEKLRREVKVSKDFADHSNAWFKVMYEGGVNDKMAREVLRILSDARREIGRNLQLYPKRRINVILFTKEQFVSSTLAPHWSGAVYDGKIKVPISPGEWTDQRMAELTTMLNHEYTHAVVQSVAGAGVPSWFNEGLATFFELDSKERVERYNKEWKEMKVLLANGVLPAIDGMPILFTNIKERDVAQLAYSVSRTFTTWLAQGRKIYKFRAVLEAMGGGSSFEEAIKSSFGSTIGALEEQWRKDLSRREEP